MSDLEQKDSSTQTALRELLEKRQGRVHMVGICGVGMAGLANLLKARGFEVSGCDIRVGRLGRWLESKGIKVVEGHDPAHIKNADWIIVTAAVSRDNAEIKQAVSSEIPVFKRGVVLPQLFAGRISIAVAGTHGKTTTTTFTAQVLKNTGRNVSWCIGGEPPDLDGVSGSAGPDRDDFLVVEADESDGTLINYEPDISVVTNIEFDHMEHFESAAAFEDCFRKFAANTRKRVVYCHDDPRATSICGSLEHGVSYGLKAGAVTTCDILSETPQSSRFVLKYRGEALGELELPVPGRHNIVNALAVCIVALELGLSFEELKRALGRVKLPRRRFEEIARKDGIIVMSDYAHHPSEIKALIATALKQKPARLVAVYQPHRYTRTLALGAEFPESFRGVDVLILAPVYAASEKPLKGGTTWDLYAHFRKKSSGEDQAITVDIVAASSLEHAWEFARRQLKAGDIFLVTGAGDVEKIAEWAGATVKAGQSLAVDVRTAYRGLDEIVQKCRATTIRYAEPLASMTTLGIGGRADVWMEIGSGSDLAAILKWTSASGISFRVLGGGSNVLVSDTGVCGVTARLSGSEFAQIRADGNIVTAGGGVSNAALLAYLEEHDLGGLEFLEGIPGAVGGAVRMNAGAWGQELKDKIAAIRCLRRDGAEERLRIGDLGMEYRRCACLDDKVLIEASFALEPMDAGEIRKRRHDFNGRRVWMKGVRSAGSVFKNPGGHYAGRLIEEAGLKGKSVGGVSVSMKHGNFFVARKGATASDFRALIEIVKAEVFDRSGVCLEPEVALFE